MTLKSVVPRAAAAGTLPTPTPDPKSYPFQST